MAGSGPLSGPLRLAEHPAAPFLTGLRGPSPPLPCTQLPASGLAQLPGKVEGAAARLGTPRVLRRLGVRDLPFGPWHRAFTERLHTPGPRRTGRTRACLGGAPVQGGEPRAHAGGLVDGAPRRLRREEAGAGGGRESAHWAGRLGPRGSDRLRRPTLRPGPVPVSAGTTPSPASGWKTKSSSRWPLR